MAKCINFNDREMSDKRDILAIDIKNNIDVIDPRAVAEMVLNRNNGNTIDKNVDGTESVSYKSLINEFGYNKGFIMRLNMFTDSFMNMVGEWTESGKEPVLTRSIPTTYSSSVNSDLYSNKSVFEIDLAESEFNKENEEMLKCLGYAKNGISTSMKEGGHWRVKEHIIGPSHEKGGVDVKVNGTYLNVGGKPIKAEEGLYFNNMISAYSGNDNGVQASQYVIDPVENTADNSLSNLMSNYSTSLSQINQAKVELANQQADQAAADKAKKEKAATTTETTTESTANEVKTEEEAVAPASDYTVRYEGIGSMNTKGVKCGNGMCSAFVQEEMYSNINPDISFQDFRTEYGVSGDAWEIIDNMTSQGGTIVDKDYAAGDVVEINNPASKYQKEATRDGSGSTHIGILDQVDGNVGYIIHNWGGQMYRTPINTETGEFLDKKFAHLTRGRTARKK